MLAITPRDSCDAWVFFHVHHVAYFLTYRMSIDIAGILALQNQLIILIDELRNVLGSSLINEQVSRCSVPEYVNVV